MPTPPPVPLVSFSSWRRIALGAGAGVVFGIVLTGFLLLTGAMSASSGAMPATRVLTESLTRACEQFVPWLLLWLIVLPALLRVPFGRPWLALLVYAALAVLFVPRVIDAALLSSTQLAAIALMALVTGLPVVRAGDVWLPAAFLCAVHIVIVSFAGMPFGGSGGYGVFDARLTGDELITGGRLGPAFGLFGMLGLLWVAGSLIRHQRMVFASAARLTRSRRDALGDFALGLVMSAAAVSLAFIVTLLARQARVSELVPSISALASAAAPRLGASIAHEWLYSYVLVSVILLIVRRGWAAVVITAAIAAGVHLMAPSTNAFTAASVAAAALAGGAAFISTGRLWMPVALGFGWLFFEGPVFGFASGGIPATQSWFRLEFLQYTVWSGGVIGPDASIIGIAAKLLMAAAVVAFARKETP